jgi:hypothetical protein
MLVQPRQRIPRSSHGCERIDHLRWSENITRNREKDKERRRKREKPYILPSVRTRTPARHRCTQTCRRPLQTTYKVEQAAFAGWRQSPDSLHCFIVSDLRKNGETAQPTNNSVGGIECRAEHPTSGRRSTVSDDFARQPGYPREPGSAGYGPTYGLQAARRREQVKHGTWLT